MTLPNDPYEVTTQQLIEADSQGLETLEEVANRVAELKVQLQARIDAYKLALEGYRAHRAHRPTSPAAQEIHSAKAYADELHVVEELRGLTNGLQRLVKLGLMNNRQVKLTEAGRIMHRNGIMNGKWRNVPARLYNIVKDNPDVFEKVAPGEYKILPGAEKHLPQSPQHKSNGHINLPVPMFR